MHGGRRDRDAGRRRGRGPPFPPHCGYRGDPAGTGPPDPFPPGALKKGAGHKSGAESDRPDMERAACGTPEGGFMLGAPVHGRRRRGPAGLSACPPGGMRGDAGVPEGRGGASAFGGRRHIVREIKAAGHTGGRHAIRAAFCAPVPGRIRRYTPERFPVAGGDETAAPYPCRECGDAPPGCAGRAGRMRGGRMPPAVHGNGAPPRPNRRSDAAIRNDGVSPVRGAGPGMRAGTAGAGFGMVRAVAPYTAAGLRRARGVRRGTSPYCMEAARAAGGGECAGRGGRTGLPDRATGMFPDLEGPGGASGGATGGCLVGALVRGDGAGAYHQIAAGRRRECMVPERFLDLMDGREGHAVCRRHRCGGTGPRSVTGRHGTERRRIPEPGAVTCPFPAATGAFAFPTHADGIRDMAGWPRFRRRHGNAGAAPAIGPYPRYAGDPEAGREGMGGF